MRLDPHIIRLQIANLRTAYPDLIADDESWLLAIESETDLDLILTQIVRQIEDSKALMTGTGERLTDLQERKLRFARRVESLRSLAFKIMDAAGVKSKELPEATLSVRNGQQQLVGEVDPEALPDELVKVSRSPDRTAIKDALKDGRTVPGFSLSNAPPSLTIRIK